MIRRSCRLSAGNRPLRSFAPTAAAEVLEERTLLTAYVVDTLSDAVAVDGQVSLREAVRAASLNATVNEAAAGQAGSIIDTISFHASLAGGTIVLGGTRLDVAGALTVTGLGASQLAISGNDAVQIFAVAAGANVRISNVTLTDGYGAHTIETFDGGAIANLGVLTLTSVVISNSTATFRGAAIYNEGSVTMTGGVIKDSTGTDAVENSSGSFSATNTIFRRNLAGSIHNWRTVSIVACLFEDNAGASGSAIDNFGHQATVSVTRSQFLRNDGSAIKNQGLTFQIADSSFVGNTAGSGGAIHNFSGIMDISGSTFTQNRATNFHGGAIESSGTLRMSNSTVSGNDAAWDGGAFYIWTGTATFRNVTVVGNRGKLSSSLGDGGGFYITGSTTVVTLHNSIVAGNTIEAGTPQDIVGVVSGQNNIIGTAGAAGGFVNGTNGNIVGIDWTTVLDPVLRNNGGPTLTHALIAGSAAINAGLNSAALAPNGSTLVGDQRGVPRISAGVVDIGAYEVPTGLVVDTLVDENDGNYLTGDLSLREAIDLVENGGTITFASNLAGGTIALTLGQLVLDEDVMIVGLGAGQLRINAQNNSRIFKVDASVTAAISGLTLIGGRIDGGFGGSIENAGTLTVTGSTIGGSFAAFGGAIFNVGTLTSIGSTISGNTGVYGGAIFNVGTSTVISSTISGNSAVDGGAIFNDDRNSIATVVNSTISGNLAESAGGGVYASSGGTVTITNSTITGNRSDSDGSNDATHVGGGLRGIAGGVTLNNSIVAGNFRGIGSAANDIAGDLGTIVAASHNVIGDAASSAGITNNVNGNIVGVDWTTVLDPVLRNNGGPTLTHALLRNSIAIDAGSDAEAVDADGLPLAFDQRGSGFARILRGRVDIGAFEQTNAGPVAANDAFMITEDESIVGSLFADHGSGIDLDADLDEISITSVTINGIPISLGTEITLASGALLTVNADGSFTYDTNGVFDSLNPGQSAFQTLSYQIADGVGGTATATVTITVRGTNIAPIATNDEVRVGEYENATGSVFANDSDADGHPLQVTKINGNALAVGHTITLDSGARLTLKADGSFVYDPYGAFGRLLRGETANDSFTYTTSDGFDAVTATVSITIYGGGGEADLIAYANGEWVVGTSDGDGFVTTTWAVWTSPAWAGATVFRQGDFNGDGLTDVLGVLRGGLWVGTSNGSSFETNRWGGWSNLDWKDVRVGDLNADGKDDVLARYRGSWWVSISTGANFATATRWTGWSDLDWRHVALADLNGDGKQDLLANLNGAWWANLSNGGGFEKTTRWGAFPRLDWSAVGTCDINNDGKADVYGFSHGTWYVGLSTGLIFHVAEWADWGDAPWQDAVVGDFNGDGRDDLAARRGRNWWVSLTQDDGTVGGKFAWATWQNASWSDVQVGDFNGDGLDDIAGRDGSSWHVGRSTGSAFTTSLWGEWHHDAWQAVAAHDADGPPALPPLPTDGAALAQYWSSIDDEELGQLLGLAV